MRRVASVLGLFVLAVLVPLPAALASPPTNDNFAGADIVGALPFTDSGDLAGTTTEAGEPSSGCLPAPVQTVWYVYTPTLSHSVKVDIAGSDFAVTANAFQSTGGGLSGLSFVGCASAFGAPVVFAATAGATYYIQIGVAFPGGTHLSLRIESVLPPPNDNFAAAEALGPPPLSRTVDLTAATVEPGEPSPAGSPVVRSAWYTFTPAATGTLLVRGVPDPVSVLAVYTGTTLGGLTPVASGPGFFPPLWFTAQAGTTYYLQAAKSGFPFPGFSPTVSFTIEAPGPVTANFVSFPSDPNAYEFVQFIDASSDASFIGFSSMLWTFGDGGTATGCCPSHRYAGDGDYLATLAAQTYDGRTATVSQTVRVRTHDVSIERIQAPNSARAGQAKPIGVNVRGGKYDETVQVDVFRSRPGGFDEWVGSQTLAVPAARGGKTVSFGVNYTFTADDATAGKVTFRSTATLVGARDAVPADNQAIAPPTEVRA